MDVLTTIRELIKSEFDAYNTCFDTALQSEYPLLREVLPYVSAKRGKQLRPLLILLVAKSCGAVTPAVIRLAVSMELLHTASLVHDDVVDSAAMRRGQRSVNDVWNNKVAVLVGDFLLAKSLEMGVAAENQKALSYITAIGQSLATGELLQLSEEWRVQPNEQIYFNIIRQKTAMLFATCCAVGATASGATHAVIEAVRAYGEALGICFQLKDDWLDYVADATCIGKPVLNDVHDGKFTLPLIKALEQAPNIEAERIRQQIISRQISDLQAVKVFVQQYGGLDYTVEMMQQYSQTALHLLETFGKGELKEALRQLVFYASDRGY